MLDFIVGENFCNSPLLPIANYVLKWGIKRSNLDSFCFQKLLASPKFLILENFSRVFVLVRMVCAPLLRVFYIT